MARTPQNSEPTVPAASAPHNFATYDPARNRVLWITVICFGILIVGLWGWAIERQVRFFPWTKAPEARIVSDAQTYWNHIFAEQQAQDDAYSKTKDKLQQLMEQYTTSSTASVASSTMSSTKP